MSYQELVYQAKFDKYSLGTMSNSDIKDLAESILESVDNKKKLSIFEKKIYERFEKFYERFCSYKKNNQKTENENKKTEDILNEKMKKFLERFDGKKELNINDEETKRLLFVEFLKDRKNNTNDAIKHIIGNKLKINFKRYKKELGNFVNIILSGEINTTPEEKKKLMDLLLDKRVEDGCKVIDKNTFKLLYDKGLKDFSKFKLKSTETIDNIPNDTRFGIIEGCHIENFSGECHKIKDSIIDKFYGEGTVYGGKVYAKEDSKVYAKEDSTIYAEKDSKIFAEKDSTVFAEKDSKVYAKKDSTVFAEKDSIVFAEEDSIVFAKKNSTVFAKKNSTVYAEEGSTVYAEEGSTIYAEKDSTVFAKKNSTVYAEEGSTIYAYEDSTFYDEKGSRVFTKKGSKVYAKIINTVFGAK